MGDSPLSLTDHCYRDIDGVFEIVGVVGRRVVSSGKLHAIVSRAHFAQNAPEMARDRFGFLERHCLSPQVPHARGVAPGFWRDQPGWTVLGRFSPYPGLVTFRQTFVN
jgi:hypothetical protein